MSVEMKSVEEVLREKVAKETTGVQLALVAALLRREPQEVWSDLRRDWVEEAWELLMECERKLYYKRGYK
jgi:hypothetical protein